VTGRARIAAVLAVVLAGALAGAVAACGGGPSGPGPDRRPARAPRAAPPGPASDLAWWSPVNGEPVGLALDDDAVAVAALDEVRLLGVPDGRVRWRTAVPGVRRYRPAIAGDRVVATGERALTVLDRRDGTTVATVPVSGPGPVALLPDGAGALVAVAASESGAVVGVDAADGRVRWSADHPGSVMAAPVGGGGTGIVTWPGRTGGTVRAFAVATGAVVWERPVGPVVGAPLVHGDRVVVVEGPGIHGSVAVGLDLRTGAEGWRVPLPGWWDGAVEGVAGPDGVWLLDGMGTVVALDPASGRVRWRQETGRPLVQGRLALLPGVVAFASAADDLCVLGRSDGRIRAVRALGGVPADLVGTPGRLRGALRLGRPSRVEALPAP
jgi:outer membrane protein assembly factor BamB